MVKFPQIQLKNKLNDTLSMIADRVSWFFNYHLSFISDHLSVISDHLSFGRRSSIINYKLSFGRRSPIINYKLLIIVLVGVVLALGGGVYIAAQNGWFGGGAAIPEDTMARGLVGSWSFDEGKGQMAYDASGNGNNGTLGSSAIADSADPEWVTGKNAGALQFDGKNDYVNVGANAILNMGTATDFSLEAWVKTTSTANWSFIYDKKGSVAATGVGYSIYYNNGVPFFLISDGTNQVGASHSTLINDGKWHHFLAVADRDGNAKIYIDGVAGNNVLMSSVGNIDNANAARMGTRAYLDWFSKCSLDDVRVYNRALTAAEIKYHYNQGGPVGYWKFDEGSGLKARDESGNNNDGTLTGFNSTDSGTAEAGASTTLTDNDKAWTVNQWTNGTIAITAGTGLGQTRAIASNTATVITVSSAWTANPDATSVYSLTQANPWTDGKYGGAIQFDGKDDVIDVGTNNSIKPTKDITLEFWVKPGASQNTYADIYGYHGVGGFVVQQNVSQLNKFYFGYWNGSSYQGMGVVTQLNTGQWNHFVVQKNGTVVRHYLNGVFIGQVSVSGDIAYAANQHMYIGNGYTGLSRVFNGLMDEVRVYDYARTADEIRLDYQAGMAAHLGPTGKTCAQDPASCMDKGLVGYWPLDEGGGLIANDKSGNGNKGTLTGGPKWTDGKNGGALQFDGKDDQVRANNSSSLNFGTGNFAIEVWVKANKIQNGEKILIRKDLETQSPRRLYSLRLVAGSPGFDIYDDSAGTPHVIVSSSDVLVVGRWYHLLGVKEGAVYKIYVDGVLKNSITEAQSHNSDNTGNLVFGRYTDNNGGYFNGLIDDVRIYNRALSAEEVRYHYNEGGPVGYWKFDEGSGTKARDDSGNNNDGTISGTATWTDGRYGSALSFNGSTNFVNVGSSSSLNLVNALTLTAWVKLANGVRSTIIGKGTGSTGVRVYYFFKESDNKLHFGWTDDNALPISEVISTSTIDDLWHYVSVTFNAGVVNIYIDGIKKGSGSGDTSIQSCAQTYIGATDWAGGRPNGSIDDVKIYNYARAADEIRLDYQAGMATHLGPSGQTCALDPASCMDKGLVGYWNMDEGGGLIANDKSGNGNKGTLVGGPKWTTGKNGGALQFDGKNDYIEKTSFSGLPSSAITVEAWVKGNFNSSWMRILNHEWEYSSGSWTLFLKNSEVDFGLYTTVQVKAIKTIALNNNTWYHIIGMYDGTTVKVYVNGVLGVSQPVSTSLDSSGNIDVGGKDAGSFNGLIDDVRIYNRALSPEEVGYHYNQGEPVAHWAMDEGKGTKAFDDSGNNNKGILGDGTCQPGSGTCPSWVAGKIGSALSFDGSDDYVNCGTSSALNVATGISIGAWINPITLGENQAGHIVSRGTTNGWLLYLYDSKNLKFFGSLGAISAVSNANSIVLNRWQYVEVTYDKQNVKFYIDGKLNSTTPETDSLTNLGSCLIGSRTVAGDYDFNGQIDDVKIYNYARTAAQIQVDYNAGVASHLK